MTQSTRRAVLVSVEPTQDGSQISLDDAVPTDLAGGWKQVENFTHKEVMGDFLDLSEADLAAFGYHILARLSAFNSADEL